MLAEDMRAVRLNLKMPPGTGRSYETQLCGGPRGPTARADYAIYIQKMLNMRMEDSRTVMCTSDDIATDIFSGDGHVV